MASANSSDPEGPVNQSGISKRYRDRTGSDALRFAPGNGPSNVLCVGIRYLRVVSGRLAITKNASEKVVGYVGMFLRRRVCVRVKAPSKPINRLPNLKGE
jgi:hypothetical protein